MKRKISIEIVRSYAHNNGDTLVSEEYINSREKLTFKCPFNHVFLKSWAKYNSGQRCSVCSANNRGSKRRLSQEYIVSEINKTGELFIEGEYLNGKSKLTLKCKKQGHLYTTIWNRFCYGSRCGICANNTRLELDEVRRRALLVGSELISTEYKNKYDKLHFRCLKAGHEYWTSLDSISLGSRCGYCCRNKPLAYEYVQSEIEKCDYKLISKTYIDAQHKLEIECSKGHKYFVTWGHFSQGKRCPHCCHSAPVFHEDVVKYIESSGYALLKGTYKNNRTKMLLLCPEGHKYWCTWDTFSRGVRCSSCTEYGFNPNKPGSLYYAKIQTEIGHLYKIGITNRTPYLRLKELSLPSTLLWHKPYLFGYMAYEEEQVILKKFAKYKIDNPDFKGIDGASEMFTEDVLMKDTMNM